MATPEQSNNIFEYKKGNQCLDICDVPREAIFKDLKLPGILRLLPDGFLDNWSFEEHDHARIDSVVHIDLERQVQESDLEDGPRDGVLLVARAQDTRLIQQVTARSAHLFSSTRSVGYPEYQQVDDFFYGKLGNRDFSLHTIRGSESDVAYIFEDFHTIDSNNQYVRCMLERSNASPSKIFFERSGDEPFPWKIERRYDDKLIPLSFMATIANRYDICQLIWKREFLYNDKSHGLLIIKPQDEVRWRSKIICFKSRDFSTSTIEQNRTLVDSVVQIDNQTEKNLEYELLFYGRSSLATNAIVINCQGERFSGLLRYTKNPKPGSTPHTIVGISDRGQSGPRYVVIPVESIRFEAKILKEIRPAPDPIFPGINRSSPPGVNVDTIYGPVVSYEDVQFSF